MKKLLIYSNDWEELKLAILYRERLEGEGSEVAVATDDKNLMRACMVSELLLVNPSRYYYDVVVTDKVLENKVSFKDFEAVMRE